MSNNTKFLDKDIVGDIATEEGFKQVSLIAGIVLDNESAGEIYKFGSELEKELKTNSGKLGGFQEKYREILLRCHLKTVALLSDAELEDVLRTQLKNAFKLGVDLKKSISMMFVPFFGQKDYDRLTRILRDIESNSEMVGAGDILLPDRKTAGPLVSNWLKDYKAQTVEDRGSLNIVTYLTKSANTKKLEPESAEFLKYVLGFYDWLRFNASKTSFIEEDNEQIVFPGITAPVPARPVPVPAPAKLQTQFDQKLSQVSSPRGASIDFLKAEARQRGVVPPVAPRPIVPRPAGPAMTPQEIKREVQMPELSAPEQEKRMPIPMQKPVPVPPRPMPPVPSMNISEIKTIDDLKKIGLSYIRGGNPQAQTANLKSKMLNLAQANHLLPYYAVNAFEQSPLFKVYLSHGSRKVTGESGNDDLTQAEFEVLTDLKKEIERL